MGRVVEWLKIHKWKLIKAAVIILAVIIVGGLLYGTISGYILNAKSDRIITDLESDNKRISDRLEASELRVEDLIGTIKDLNAGNIELANELETSERIRGDIESENNRLRGFIGESQGSAEAISNTNRLLIDSNERVKAILDRYPLGSE